MADHLTDDVTVNTTSRKYSQAYQAAERDVLLENRMLERLKEFTEKLESKEFELVSKDELARLRKNSERWEYIAKDAWFDEVWKLCELDHQAETVEAAVDAAIAAEKASQPK